MLENLVIYSASPKNNDLTIKMTFALAEKFNSKITLLKCIYKNTPKFGLFQTSLEKENEGLLKKEAEDALSNLKIMAKQSNVSIETRLVFVDSLCEYVSGYVKKHKVDLLIADSIPPEDITNLDYKETVNRIYSNVTCPILTLK